MEVLSPLQPKAVFHYFEELCAIPHGSGNTKAVSDWCAAFAKARGLEYHQDALNNIIIIKEAAPGYEGAEPVILQGHLDMVCEKEPGCPKDLEREGLDLEADGDFVTARGTTLGGDDGIAVAMALALLDSRDIPHPRLEVVLTVDEEVGMLGAAADAATNALPKIDSAAQGTLVDFNIEELLSGMNFSDGTLSIPKIASIKQDLSDAGVVLKRVKTSIYALPQPHTEQITEMVNQGKQVVAQIDEAFDTLNTIVEKIPG